MQRPWFMIRRIRRAISDLARFRLYTNLGPLSGIRLLYHIESGLAPLWNATDGSIRPKRRFWSQFRNIIILGLSNTCLGFIAWCQANSALSRSYTFRHLRWRVGTAMAARLQIAGEQFSTEVDKVILRKYASSGECCSLYYVALAQTDALTDLFE